MKVEFTEKKRKKKKEQEIKQLRRNRYIIIKILYLSLVLDRHEQEYTVTLMARASLGPWKCVLDMSSSCHQGLIIASDKKADEDNTEVSFQSSIKELVC